MQPRLDLDFDLEPQRLPAFLDAVLAAAEERPLIVDSFCCQGGATLGYGLAGLDSHPRGFYVVGIDIDPQPRYCGPAFIRGDALAVLAAMTPWIRRHVLFVHASPPCQGYSDTQVLRGRDHPKLIGPVRELLTGTGVPWVIENVPGARAHMNSPVVLCGTMFGHKTYRDRWFESGGGLVLDQPHHPRHDLPITQMGRPRRVGQMAHYVGNFSGVAEARNDLGVPTMNRDGIRECIPPSYARWVGLRAAAQFLPRTQAGAAA
ncbi:SAM-dependent methyltransferase [Kitasatospora sp. NPDC048722]|uniref:SAM-dependent methyltransferase n=1 Tax=Kitasatospora sp. NPDC048722 TaxID=3155639 RepID=UPI0033D86A0F